MRKESVIASLISVKEAAQRAKLTNSQILNAIKAGQLKAVQPGGRKYLIMKRDLVQYLNDYKPQTTTTPLFTVPDNRRNIEIRNQAANLMLQGNRLLEQAYNLLKEIA